MVRRACQQNMRPPAAVLDTPAGPRAPRLGDQAWVKTLFPAAAPAAAGACPMRSQPLRQRMLILTPRSLTLARCCHPFLQLAA
ncbi:MAG: hypothetical protein K6T86_05885 [Pirellulales bacterium]|nr:hypothetical protein [Pirellulales bacterium]